MNRISECLARLKNEGKKALVSYIVTGDPEVGATLPAMHALVDAGTDIIELGVPFSDPMAEGPIIQRGHERALENGASLKSTLELVAEFRKTNTDTPIVLMGYANPVERMGYGEFAEGAASAGVDGLLTVDLPPEEAEMLCQALKNKDIENIFLLAPTTSDTRIADVAALAGGFLYYVSLKGVTGAGHLDVDSVKQKLQQIRARSDLPVLVGFGIKDAESASAVAALSDGVVVGSVLVDSMGSAKGETPGYIADKLQEIIRPIRKALDELS